MSALLTLAYQHADKLLTTGILGERETGYLVVAFVINFGVIELVSSSALVAAYPVLSRYHEGGRNPIFGFMIEKLALWMLLAGLPLALGVSILAEAIILPLLGETYAPSADILRLLIWYTAITMFGNVFSKALLIQNRQRRLLAIRASGLASECGADGDSALRLGGCARRGDGVHCRRDTDCGAAAGDFSGRWVGGLWRWQAEPRVCC